jgi:cation diffusion facilitator family transporter
MSEVMTKHERTTWHHEHTFGQDQPRPGERRTHIVIVLTAVMMVAEVLAGLAFGSMALLADGLHMASHAVALSITALAYLYTRRHARNSEFSFGTGKMNALGGFTGAVLLAVFALMMGWESVERLLAPVGIAFDQAIVVAVLGLLVNGASVLILGLRHSHEPHDEDDHHAHHHEHDHGLRSAHLHVLADALTSFLAIFALLSGKYYGLDWMDPLMGIVGALLVARWSVGLLRSTSGVLLDKQAPPQVRERVRTALEQDGDARVVDLHLWFIAPGLYSLVASLVAKEPRAPEDYKRLLPPDLHLVHRTVEVHRLEGPAPVRAAGAGQAETHSAP